MKIPKTKAAQAKALVKVIEENTRLAANLAELLESKTTDLKPCPECGKLTGERRKTYCSEACQVRAGNARRNRASNDGLRNCLKCRESFAPRDGREKVCLICRTYVSDRELHAVQRPLGCSNCIHAIRSAEAASGWLCRLEQAMQCRPWGPSTRQVKRFEKKGDAA